MSYVSENFRLFNISNISALNFLIVMLMCIVYEANN